MTNQAIVAGEVISEFQFSHEIFGEGFYRLTLSVQRLSNASDEIPLLISDRLVDVKKNYIGKKLEARGQFRSYNQHVNEKNHLILSLFVRELEWIDSYENRKPNYIMLDGYVCKEPIYRMTPLGREICDILLAVNRAYGKSDYIPCICWGRNARFAGNLEVGAHIQILGRIQSRRYQKKIGENEIITRMAYEISVNKLEIQEE
jgi:primosomal replication protein N